MMRNWFRYNMLIPVLLIAEVFSACADGDEPILSEDGPVAASLALSLSATATPQTRMGDAILQINGERYRGLTDVRIVPYEAADASEGVQPGDRAKAFTISGTGNDNYDKMSASLPSWYYYYKDCSFARGSNAVLFYGRAVPSGDKANNGSLKAYFPSDMQPSRITFQLDQMVTDANAVPAGAQAVADYLTGIARATGWSTTTDSKLRALYLNFTGQGNEENALLAGSAASATAYALALKAEMEKLGDSDVKTAILDKIGTPSLGTYPATADLPDGAAALQWDSEAVVSNIKGAFVPQTRATTEALINTLTRFVYPAELYYYGNSRLYTSNAEVENTVYSGNTDWNAVLAEYTYKGTTPVSGNTKAVAVEKPVNYGVARLQMTLSDPTVTLKDGKNQTVSYSAATMPLTAIIIGGQHMVGYDFKPQGTPSDVDHRFIYDKNVSGKITNTLVLQSYDNEPVKMVLEFQNPATGTAFTGKDGIIYPGTKFYLVGSITPPTYNTGDPDYKKRVFTQDHTTEVTMKFNETSMAHAYNVLPDLLSPRLEVGVQVVSKWVQTEPGSVPLNQ